MNLPVVTHLHVTSPIITVASKGEHDFVTIPAGSVIETFDDLNDSTELHPVRFDGRSLLAFKRDIGERTEQIDAVGAGTERFLG